MRKMYHLLILVLLLFKAFHEKQTSAQAEHFYNPAAVCDLSLRWFVREGENFRVLFPVHLNEAAKLILKEAEDVYPGLATWVGFLPDRKIDIVVTDTTDYANGFVAPGSRGLFITIAQVRRVWIFSGDGTGACSSMKSPMCSTLSTCGGCRISCGASSGT